MEKLERFDFDFDLICIVCLCQNFDFELLTLRKNILSQIH